MGKCLSDSPAGSLPMTEVLGQIAAVFNSRSICWALGASMMLHFHGIVEIPHDIDIIVSAGDIGMADSLLSSMGRKTPKKPTDKYSTGHFYEYTVQGVEIDLMSDFRIKTDSGTYEYEFNSGSQLEYYRLGEITIPLNPVEDWYLLYQLMGGRDEKVLLIEDYLRHNGINHDQKLRKSVNENIPYAVKTRIEKFFE